jgi:hypothetical protein
MLAEHQPPDREKKRIDRLERRRRSAVEPEYPGVEQAVGEAEVITVQRRMKGEEVDRASGSSNTKQQ